MAETTIDCTGLMCPLPIIEINKKMSTLNKGDILKIEADDPAFEPDIKAWAKRTNNPLLAIEKKDNLTTIILEKA
ncbi:sulfurtransferase TusA family protein [Candidatus Margulisiibacteriota bacterium]